MSDAHACGPDADPEFFRGLAALFEKFPDLVGKYHIHCVDHEIELLGVDWSKQGSLKRIEGGKVVTEFMTRDILDKPATGTTGCCGWENGKCVTFWA